MPDLSPELEARVLEAVISEYDQHERRLATLRDPEKLARMCGLALRPEDAAEGVWFTFEEGSPYRTIHRFLREPNGRDKLVLGTRGGGKTTMGLMESCVDLAEDQNFTVFMGGETAINVRDRALGWRTMIERKAFKEYGIEKSDEEWAASRWTVKRSRGIGLQPTCSVTSPDKPGTGKHYRRRLVDDPNGEETFRSQKKAESSVKWHQVMTAQSLPITHEWMFGTPWPGITIYRNRIRDEIEGGFHFEPYDRGIVHRGRDWDVLVLGAFDPNGDPIWPCWDKKALERAYRKLASKILWETQFLCQFVLDSAMQFEGHWIKWEDPLEDDEFTTYMVVDTATSTSKDRSGTSQSSLSVLSLNAYDTGYLREMEMGRIPPKKMAGKIVAMWKRWKPRKLILEKNASAAQMLEPQIQERAQKERIGRIPVLWVNRTADKDFRILVLRDRCAEGRLKITETVAKAVFDRGESGGLKGSVGRMVEDYAYGSGESYDGLDNLADYWITDKYGKRICKPPEKAEEEKAPQPVSMEALGEFFKKYTGQSSWVG